MSRQALPRRRTFSPTLPLLLLILAASLLPRLPILWNAEIVFNSDEAANALVIRHLLAGKDFAVHNWGTHYYGIVEGLLAIPLTRVFGFTPLAFKLAAVAGFLLLVAASYRLGRRLYGPAEGLVGAALLAVFSPHLVLWSTLASGGYALVVGWGSLTLLHLAATRERTTAGRVALFGFLVGFGLYIYELFLIYVAVLAGFALTASFLWQALLAPSRQESAAALRRAPGQLRLAVLFAAGFLAGWAPRLWTLVSGGGASKVPSYGLAGAAAMRENLELLVTRCVPALFGINPAGARDLVRWVGPAGNVAAVFGLLLLAAWAAAWLWAVPRTAREVAAALRRPPGPPGGMGMESLLVLLVPVTAVLFVLSPNPTGVLSSHYLLPWLTSLPVLAGAWLVRLWRRRRVLAVGLMLLLVGYPAVQTVRWYTAGRYLATGLSLARAADPLHEVLRGLRRQGIRGGYGWYWIAYEANFLSGEEIVIAPSEGWDRYPAYTRFVDSLPAPAYLFELSDRSERAKEAAFVRRVRALGRPFARRQVGPYAVYTSPRGERLLPLSIARGPQRLERPRAAVTARGVPAVVAAGAVLEVPVRLTNRGAEIWPAFGAGGTGHFRVALSYRWIDAGGRWMDTEAVRTPLPDDVRPGETVDLVARVRVPEVPGAWRLEIMPLQEDVLWFIDAPDGGFAAFPVTVRAPVPAGSGG